jgi:transposase
MARSHPGATAVMEAGTHSPWVSRFLQELGLRVIVANPRKTSFVPSKSGGASRRKGKRNWR